MEAAPVKLAWSRRTRQHLIDLRAYVELDKPEAAERLGIRIAECVDLLRLHPLAGSPGRITGTRELAIARTPYIVPYRIRPRSIDLLAVFHSRQKWPKNLWRLKPISVVQSAKRYPAVVILLN